jgi:hypothetical protein
MPCNEDTEYYEAVNDFMIHSCHKGHNGCLKDDNTCKLGYNKLIIQKTTLDAKGYPSYKRPTTEDLQIVPYNKEILLDWNAHSNVEYCGTTYTVVYLYKYFFKGNKKVKINLNNTDDVNPKDEIKLYLRGRMICSMDAMWQIYGFQNYPASTPSVTILKIKLPEAMELLISEAKLCNLYIYFNRPQSLNNLKYTEMFTTWDYSLKQPRNSSNIISNDEPHYYTIRLENLNKNVYIYKKRQRGTIPSVMRIEMIPLQAGEKWYLRLILYNYPAKSYNDALTINNITFETFQAAAIARGYITNKNEVVRAFIEAITFSTPTELRSLLVMFTLQGFPTMLIFNDEDLHFKLLEDYFFDLDGNINLANNQLLNDLNERFEEEDVDMAIYGFPKPLSDRTELDREILKYNKNEQHNLLISLLHQAPNTDEQQLLYEHIITALDNNDTLFIFLQGQGGSEKSTFAKKYWLMLDHAEK